MKHLSKIALLFALLSGAGLVAASSNAGNSGQFAPETAPPLRTAELAETRELEVSIFPPYVKSYTNVWIIRLADTQVLEGKPPFEFELIDPPYKGWLFQIDEDGGIWQMNQMASQVIFTLTVAAKDAEGQTGTATLTVDIRFPEKAESAPFLETETAPSQETGITPVLGTENAPSPAEIHLSSDGTDVGS